MSNSYDDETRRLTEYATQKVDPVLKPMLERLFTETPDDPAQFMLSYLNEKLNKRKMTKVSFNNADEKRLNEIFDAEPSVYIPPESLAQNYPKSPRERERIEQALKGQVLFAQLNDPQIKVVVNSMEKRYFKKGDKIIIQGDVGDYFYILDEGKADCFVAGSNTTQAPVLVRSFVAGECFGELALMYNRPRGASIVAQTDCACWCLDRVTFRRVLITDEARKQKAYESFLTQVPLLKPLNKQQLAKIADALEEKSYADGEFVIRQGDVGDMFYIIVEGNAKVTKMFELGEDAKELMKLGTGKYFGELALLKDQPRNANVIADGPLRVVGLNRAAFDRLLGDVVTELRERQSLYERMEKEKNYVKPRQKSQSS